MQQMNNPIEQETIKRAFDTNPDTVYGILVGLLVLAIIYLAWQLRQKDHKLIELNTASIEVLKDLHSGLLLLHEKIDHLKEMTHGKAPQ